MLVIGRHKDESIIIDGTIEITVNRIQCGVYKKVILGITAPRDVSVHRKEIQEVIDRENRQAVPSLIG